MLNKAGAAILTSPFSPFLLSPFVYLSLISHLFIYLFFLCLPSHSSTMYVNCVMPFNSNIGLQRALNEQSTSKHASLRLFSSSRRTSYSFSPFCSETPSLHKEAPKNSPLFHPPTPPQSLIDPDKTLIPIHSLHHQHQSRPPTFQISPRTGKTSVPQRQLAEGRFPDGTGSRAEGSSPPQILGFAAAPSSLFASFPTPQPRSPRRAPNRARPGQVQLQTGPDPVRSATGGSARGEWQRAAGLRAELGPATGSIAGSPWRSPVRDAGLGAEAPHLHHAVASFDDRLSLFKTSFVQQMKRFNEVKSCRIHIFFPPFSSSPRHCENMLKLP